VDYFWAFFCVAFGLYLLVVRAEALLLKDRWTVYRLYEMLGSNAKALETARWAYRILGAVFISVGYGFATR
jgi:hypothetical protein